jgi:hypothetical protein
VIISANDKAGPEYDEFFDIKKISIMSGEFDLP